MAIMMDRGSGEERRRQVVGCEGERGEEGNGGGERELRTVQGYGKKTEEEVEDVR